MRNFNQNKAISFKGRHLEAGSSVSKVRFIPGTYYTEICQAIDRAASRSKTRLCVACVRAAQIVFVVREIA